MGKFKILNIEKIYAALKSLRDNPNILTKEINIIINPNKSFLPPIDEIHINIALNQLDKNKISILCIIKKDLYSNKQLNFDHNSNIYSIRNIKNFGIYIFAGRPDLSANKEFSDYLDIDNQDLFINKFKELENLVELAIKQVYYDNNIEFNLDIEYSFTTEHKEAKQPEMNKTASKQIPEALKRLYQRIDN